jgi:tetratricopeptide (TPR) repeat protein/predicted Ser/Thr protein kinase
MRERVNESVDLPTDELRAMRPASDRLEMESARERAERALFGSAAPAKLGRYVLLGQTADGGMGVVHAAYDPELHRKVALKVMHPRRTDARARERLITEARALAKLDHPNVVKVHDVITQSDQVVIVMEWIDGDTLAGWERAQARSWREIVTVYAQAAQGLAAVHGVGVIHRDFKPANAIIGSDGRVRVVDFGLARAADSADAPEAPRTANAATAAADEGWMASLTATGDMVGTLAYAAPEQLIGQAVTPASDQFAFGVSLHRALEGVSPFAGSDPPSLAHSIRAGQIARAADGRVVPAWLRASVARALSAEPAERFPSMAALLAELVRPRGWRRWRLPLFVASCAAAAVLALGLRPGGDPEVNCDGGRTDIQAVWGPAARVRVQGALGLIATPYAAATAGQVLHGLDGYRDRWTALHRDACMAHQRGAQSAALLDRRMLCLQQHLGDLRAAVSVLERLDAATVTNARDVIARMPDVGQCADLERLSAEVPPPSDAGQRAKVDAARDRVSQVAALDRAGHSAEALSAAVSAVAQAEQSAYPPVLAEALMTQGRILLARWDNHGAAAALRRARSIALAQHQFAMAVEAAARIVYAEGTEHADANVAERDAAVFLPLSESLSGDHFARPLLLNNLGTVYMAAENRAQAARYFQQAHDSLAGVTSPDLELTVIDRNLAMLTPDARQREALARGAWQRLQRETGDAHLATIEALLAYARYITEPARALPLLGRACEGLEEHHPELVDERVYCESYHAFLLGEAGDLAGQRRTFEVVIRIGAGSTDDEVISRIRIARGHLKLLTGDLSGAVADFESASGEGATSAHWWTQERAADAMLGLGEARLRLGEDAAARSLTAAAEIYRKVTTVSEDAEARLKLARVERLLDAVQHIRSDHRSGPRSP